MCICNNNSYCLHTKSGKVYIHWNFEATYKRLLYAVVTVFYIINEWVCPPGQMSKSLERVFHRLLHGGQLEYRAEELECILNIGAAVWGLCISGEMNQMMRFSETELAKFPGSCVWAQKPGNEARSKGAVGAEVALFFPGSFVRVCMSAGAWTLAMHRCYLMWLQYGRGGRSSSRGSGS